MIGYGITLPSGNISPHLTRLGWDCIFRPFEIRYPTIGNVSVLVHDTTIGIGIGDERIRNQILKIHLFALAGDRKMHIRATVSIDVNGDKAFLHEMLSPATFGDELTQQLHAGIIAHAVRHFKAHYGLPDFPIKIDEGNLLLFCHNDPIFK